MYRKSPGLSATTDKGIHDDLFDNDEGLKCAVAYDKAGNSRKLRGFIQYVVESEYGFAHINNLYVDPHERKRGVGRALLDQVIGEATKEGVDDLELFATEEAIAFYKKLGFTQDENDESDYPRMFMHLKKHS
jgi:ribosomal protein S18 acetylase RimI-like enzyme